MDEGLKIRIGADTTELQKGLVQAEASISKFGSTLKNARGTALTAVPALNSLGQVARDLPFGFIAIQNNLPIVIDQFANLTRASGGLGPALKGVAGALLGPAGITFAFGAAVAGVTALVQKYGSLGNAITELSSAQDSASISQRNLNKAVDDGVASTVGEVSTLTNLVSIIKDTQLPQEQRLTAYKSLKKEYPGIIQDMTAENALTLDGGKLIAARSFQLIEYIKLKGKEGAIIKLLEEAYKKQSEAQRAGTEILKNQNTFFSGLVNTLLGAGNAAVGLGIRVGNATDDFKDAGNEADFLSNQLFDLQRQISTFDPKITGLDKVVPKKLEKSVKVIADVNVIPDKVSLGTSLTTADAEISRQFKLQNGLNIPLTIDVPQETFAKLKAFGEAAKNAFDVEQYKKQAAEFKQILTEGLAQPLGDLFFNFFDKGKIGFKEFADVAIQSIKRIVAQLIASKIIQLLGNLIFPGAGTAGSGLFKTLFGGIGKALTPSFNGGGISGGMLNLSGGVKFDIRGTDLVGVLNRGNAQIGRIG